LSLTHVQSIGYAGFGHSRSQHVEFRFDDSVVLERAVRTVKEALQRIMVPTRREAMRTELVIVLDCTTSTDPTAP